MKSRRQGLNRTPVNAQWEPELQGFGRTIEPRNAPDTKFFVVKARYGDDIVQKIEYLADARSRRGV
jgi:hypothetical protein